MELRTCIAWKKNVLFSSLSRQLAPALKRIWENEAADMAPPVEKVWTVSDEVKLKKLKQGDFLQYADIDTHKKAFARKCKFIDFQSKLLALSYRRQIALSVYESLPEDERFQFDLGKGAIDQGRPFEPSIFEYVPDTVQELNEANEMYSWLLLAQEEEIENNSLVAIKAWLASIDVSDMSTLEQPGEIYHII